MKVKTEPLDSYRIKERVDGCIIIQRLCRETITKRTLFSKSIEIKERWIALDEEGFLCLRAFQWPKIYSSVKAAKKRFKRIKRGVIYHSID